MYRHYATEDNDGAAVPRCRFYGTTDKASVTFVFNPNVSLSKVFKADLQTIYCISLTDELLVISPT